MTQSITEILEEVLGNKNTKRYLISQSFFMFIHLYLKQYFHLGIPLFQEDMIRNLENRKIKSLLITSFIGGGKTTIVSIAYLLWEAFRTTDKKVIVHVSRSKEEAFALSAKVQSELLWNESLIDTFGQPHKKLMTRRKIVIPTMKTVIYFSYLRDEQLSNENASVLIMDDAFAKKHTNTTKEETALFEKIVTRHDYGRVVISSSIHLREGVMARLFLSKGVPCKKLSYPIVDDSDQRLWEAKYGKEEITRIRSTVGEDVWHKSYLLDLRLRSVRPFWLADVDERWRPHKDDKDKQAFLKKNHSNKLYFQRTVTLGKFTFSTPKFGITHIFVKKGEKMENNPSWFY